VSLAECKLARRLRRLREKLSLSKEQVNPPGETSAPAISRPYAPMAKARLITAQVSELLLSIEPVWAIGAAAFVYLSVLNIVGGYSWLGLMALVLPFLARWASRGYLSQRTPFDLPIGLLLVAGLIGIGVSSDKSLSWDVYQTLLVSVLFYYSFINYDRPRLLMKVGLFLAAVAVIVLVPYVWLQEPTSLPFFSQLQSWLHPDPQSLPPGWSSPPLASSACGVTVAAEVVAVIMAGVALFPGKKTTRIIAGTFTLLLLGMLVISGCHATWPILGGGMLFLLAWRSRWLLLSLPAWLGVVYLSLATWRGLDFGQAIDSVRDGLQYKWNARWEGALSMVADRPVTGWGLGMYPAVYAEYGIHGPHAHNAYLQFLCDFGLLGAIALAVAAAIFVRLGLQMSKSASNHPWLGITVGACAAILVGAAYGMVESSPACILGLGEDGYYYAISPLFAILGAGLVVAHRSLTGQSSDSGREERDSNEV